MESLEAFRIRRQGTDIGDETYRMDSYAHMWESLEQCMELFREVSAEVAQRFRYSYPDYDEKISGYVNRQKEKYDREAENVI